MIWLILIVCFLLFISIPIVATIYGVKLLDWITQKVEEYVNKKQNF